MGAQKTKEKSRAHDKRSGMEIRLYMGIVSVYSIYSVYSAFVLGLKLHPLAHEGYLMAFNKGSWLPACVHAWNMNSTLVICRDLGYELAVNFSLLDSPSDPNSSFVWFKNLACNGREEFLSSCTHEKSVIQKCSGNVVWVKCKPLGTIKWKQISRSVYQWSNPNAEIRLAFHHCFQFENQILSLPVQMLYSVWLSYSLSKALIKRERKTSQVFRTWACDDLRCHRSNVGTSRRKFWTFASGLYICIISYVEFTDFR